MATTAAHIIVPDEPGRVYVDVCHAHDGRYPQAFANRAPRCLSPRSLAVRSQEPWVVREGKASTDALTGKLRRCGLDERWQGRRHNHRNLTFTYMKKGYLPAWFIANNVDDFNIPFNEAKSTTTNNTVFQLTLPPQRLRPQRRPRTK